MPFKFTRLQIPDIILITPLVFEDSRGYFTEIYKESEFVKNGINEKFGQDNHSLSLKNVLRGLHFQKAPYAQGKLVWVAKGSVLDVAVDLRKNSSTFKKWISVELNDKNHNMIYIPEGFAHGFLTLSDQAWFIYKCTKEYNQQADSGIRWDDPELNINWSVPNILVSEKDEMLPFLKDAKIFD